MIDVTTLSVLGGLTANETTKLLIFALVMTAVTVGLTAIVAWIGSRRAGIKAELEPAGTGHNEDFKHVA